MKYNKAIITEVLAWIADGKSMRELYKSDPNKYPSPSLVTKWAATKDDFRHRYHQAQWQSVYKAQDDLIYLKRNPPTLEFDAGGDIKLLSQLTTQWKQTIATTQKFISEFAHIYDNRLKEAKNPAPISTQIVGGQQIVVMHYGDPQSLIEAQQPGKPVKS